jgi:serpin B
MKTSHSFLIGLLAVCGFQQVSAAVPPEVNAAVLADEQTLAAANTDFGFKLLKLLNQSQPGANVFISPFSASTALQMVCNGAEGETRTEIQAMLGTEALTPAGLNAGNSNLLTALTAGQTNVILTVADALWYQEGFSINPAFLACNEQFYGANVDAVSFTNPACVGTINAWVTEQTHGRITSLADRSLVSAQTKVFLADAVYFKGKWASQFEGSNTKDRPFYLQGGERITVPMMNQSGQYAYQQGSGFQAVRLPYQGGSLGMYVFLPDSSSSLDKLLGVLSGPTWRQTIKPRFISQQGTIQLPRFQMGYAVDLNQPLQTLGMKTAFSPEADFSGISSQQLMISKVQQKAFLEVDEEGTEATAVTGITVVTLAVGFPISSPFQMVVDRPFLLLIEDEETQTTLFMGIILNPATGS